MPSASDKSQLLSVLEAREDLRDIRGAEVAFQGLGEDVAEVGRDCQIAALVELLAIETGPFAVDLAAFDVAAKDEHRVAVPVIRSAIAVLAHGASDRRHRGRTQRCRRRTRPGDSRSGRLTIPHWRGDPSCRARRTRLPGRGRT